MKSGKRKSPSIEICILAGGQSSRMGRDKSQLRLGQRTLLARIRATAKQLELPVRIIQRDLKPGAGPLGGIYTALKTTRAGAVLFLACDMPFVSARLLQTVLAAFDQEAVAGFVHHRGRVGFPFVLRQSTLPMVKEQLSQRALSLQSLAQKLKAMTFRLPDGMSSELFNLNTPGDWEKARTRSLSKRDPASKVAAC